MKIGAHVSTSGGIENAIDRGMEIGCEAIQIFGSSPQSWLFKKISVEKLDVFKSRAKKTGLGPIFLHCIYLINLGNPDPVKVDKGIGSLVNYMELAAGIEAEGIIFHPGSHKGVGFDAILDQTVSSILSVLEDSPNGPFLIIENTAGMGHHIGSEFSEIGRIINRVGSPRVKVCLDTQHTFAAGYDIGSKNGLERAMEEFDREIGLERLVAIHANDSKYKLGAGVDRHENIGEGYIGKRGFENIMSYDAFREVPFFLEVPGFEGNGPDRKNIDILKEIRDQMP